MKAWAPNPSSSDEITANLIFGRHTQVDPYILKTIDVRPGGATGVSVETITIAVAGAEENQPVMQDNDQMLTGTRFSSLKIVGADGTWTGKLVYNDDGGYRHRLCRRLADR